MSKRRKQTRLKGPSRRVWAKVFVVIAALTVAVILGLQGFRWLHTKFMTAGALPAEQLPQATPSPSPSGPGLGPEAMTVTAGQRFRIGNVLFAGEWSIKDDTIVGLNATTNGVQDPNPKVLTFTMWQGDRALGNIICTSNTALVGREVPMTCPPTPADLAGGDRVTVVDSSVPLPAKS